MEQKISYSAVVLDERSKGLLRQTFGSVLPDTWEWVGHHMTICMGPITDEGIRKTIGNTVTLAVTDIGVSDKAIAVKVVGFYSTNKVPHITMGVNRQGGGKPKDSNFITDWQEYDMDLRLTGVVTEVPFKSAPLNETITDVRTLPFIGDVQQLGGKIYQVGGAVRDKFLGKDSKDLDILIQGVPADQIQAILNKYGKVDMVGASFGVIKFKAHGTSEEIDIAIPRTERKIGSGYTGFEVNADHTLPVEKDLERRDFTINSIAMDLDGNHTDPFGGKEDLKNRLIRVTNPVAFKEDPLRMLRAVQFASRFNFEIEPETFRMIQENAHTIKEITPERVVIELEKIVHKGKPEVGAMLLEQTGLFKEIFRYEPKMHLMDVAQSKTMAEFMFTMLYRSCSSVEALWTLKLKGDNKTAIHLKAFERCRDRKVENELERRKLVVDLFKIDPKVIYSFVIAEMFGMGPTIGEMRQQNLPFHISQLAVNGNDLLALGLEGRQLGETLKKVLDHILAGSLQNNKDHIVKFIKATPLAEMIQKMKTNF